MSTKHASPISSNNVTMAAYPSSNWSSFQYSIQLNRNNNITPHTPLLVVLFAITCASASWAWPQLFKPHDYFWMQTQTHHAHIHTFKRNIMRISFPFTCVSGLQASPPAYSISCSPLAVALSHPQKQRWQHHTASRNSRHWYIKNGRQTLQQSHMCGTQHGCSVKKVGNRRREREQVEWGWWVRVILSRMSQHSGTWSHLTCKVVQDT
jgi:hypothetical protein